MSIFIFYGQDHISIDKYFLKFRKDYSQTEEIEQINTTDLEEKISNPGFFAEKKLFIARNIFLKQVKMGKVSIKLDLWLQTINKFKQNYDWLFIEEDSKKIKYYQKYFPKANYQEFKVAAYLFNFLDAFRPNNFVGCYSYWQKTSLTNPDELTLFMLKRRVRDLINLSTNNLGSAYAPWQLAKLKSQLRAWPQSKLDAIYRALFSYEKNLKLGNNPLKAAVVIETILSLYL